MRGMLPRAWLVAALTIGLASCKGGTKPAPDAPASVDAAASAAPASQLEWTMTATSPTSTKENASTFRVEITAHNRGTQTVNTYRDLLIVNVNGKRSGPFKLRWNQGQHDPKWGSLPPGESVSEKRELGDFLFGLPGDYELELMHGSRSVSKLKVTVAP
jgi:hypothetical protein